jgi:hypothetical protein
MIKINRESYRDILEYFEEQFKRIPQAEKDLELLTAFEQCVISTDKLFVAADKLGC